MGERMRRAVRRASIALLVGLAAIPASADAMRCGTRLVRDGQTTAEVQSTCGAPTSAQQRVHQQARTIRHPDGTVETHFITVMIDEWTYDFGPHALVQLLTFEDGKLVRVASRGYGQPR